MNDSDHKYLANLVIRTQHNDSDAFAELYAQSYNKTYNYCRHYLRDDYLAQDAVQEIYISALKNIQKLNDPLLLIAWLNQISFHVCFDMAKKNDKTYGVAEDTILELVSDDHIDRNPEEHIFQKDELKRLNESIQKLPLNERQVIILRYYNNLKLEDIASAMDTSKSTVKRCLLSGQNTLKRLMKG